MSEPRGVGMLLTFSLLDSTTGSLLAGLSPAAEISKDAGALAATTNAVAEIGSGLYALQLTNTEAAAEALAVLVTATGALSKALHVRTDAPLAATDFAVDAFDGLLTRDISSVEGGAHPFRSLYGALSKLVNKVVSSGAGLTVYETDDTTVLVVQTLTRDASATPVVGVDTP